MGSARIVFPLFLSTARQLTSMPSQNSASGPYCNRHWWSMSYMTPGGRRGKLNGCSDGSSSRQ